ncbi:hypothetical protein [Streptomyces sp. CNQ-509]|uniref:hypothetical protein n=1 Tax=Streptomyces sp. CNQ-509 TaxID=444103 RepID=UPI0015697259
MSPAPARRRVRPRARTRGRWRRGEPQHAPHDRIVVTVEAADLAPAWVDQFTENGRIVVPLRLRGLDWSVAFQRENGSREQTPRHTREPTPWRPPPTRHRGPTGVGPLRATRVPYTVDKTSLQRTQSVPYRHPIPTRRRRPGGDGRSSADSPPAPRISGAFPTSRSSASRAVAKVQGAGASPSMPSGPEYRA